MSDDIKFACEKCGQSVSVASVHAGASLHCPGCGGPLTVPTGAPGSNAGSSGTGGISFKGDAANSEHKPGELVVKRYRLERILGRGGMGVVWLANDEQLNEPVALKFVPPEIKQDKDALKDLRRETQKSRKLSHPNIIRIHDLNQPEDSDPFISMEFVAGETMSSLRSKQPDGLFTWAVLRPLAAQLCAALDYAHSQGIVHRDLKPANLMVTESGQVKLADFGIAATISDTMGRVSLDNLSSGTPTYMSPQQIEGYPPSARDDVYALGATLYDLLTSKPPFFRGKIIHQVLNVAPVTPEQRLQELGLTNAIPPEVSAAIMACLVKDSDQRLPSVAAVAQALSLPTGGLASSSAVSVGTASQPPAAEPQMEAAPEPAAQNRRTMYWMAAAAGCVLVLAGLLVALNKPKSQTAPATSATTSTPSPTAKPADAASTFAAATTGTLFANSPSNEKWVDGLAAYWAGDWRNDALFARATGNTVRVLKGDEFFMPMNPNAPPIRDIAVRVVIRSGNGWNLGIRKLSGQPLYEWKSPDDANPNRLGVGNNGFFVKATFPQPSGFDGSARHTLEFRAVGNHITAVLDGVARGEFENAEGKQGLCGIFLAKDTIIEQFHYADLGAGAAAPTNASATKEAPLANSPSNEKWVDGLAAYWAGDQKNDGKLVLRNGKTVAPKSCVQFPPRTLPMRDQAVRVAVEGQIIGTTLIVRESRDRKYKFHNYVVKFGGSGSFDFNNGSEVTGGGYSSEGRIAAPKGFDINSLHTMELRAIGNTFTFWCDGKVLLTGPIDSNLTSGLPGVYLPSGAVVRRLEYANLDAQAPSPRPVPAQSPAAATKDAPFVNSLGMKFVPVPGTKALFSIWDTREKDFEAYAKAASKKPSWETMSSGDLSAVGHGPDFPATGITWEESRAFCEWLTAKETAAGLIPKGSSYRLPTDEEWSRAAGLPEEDGATPMAKNEKLSVFPWGTDYPPPGPNLGNYADSALHDKTPGASWIMGYADGYAGTSPVGCFPANKHGLYDMSGNVWQWCEDEFRDPSRLAFIQHVTRGASWFTHLQTELLVSHRRGFSSRDNITGFRCVLAPLAGQAQASVPFSPPSTIVNAGAAASGVLPRPDGKPADMTKPVQVFIMMGDGAMLGTGEVNSEAAKGSLAYLTRRENKYPHLLDNQGKWTKRNDVRYVKVMHRPEGARDQADWLTVSGQLIGPELQFGHVLGHALDAPVLLLKSCNGNRSLGWDLLPPGSGRFTLNGTNYAGYKDTPDKWVEGQPKRQIGNSWYAGKQYDMDVTRAKQVLENMGQHYPGAKGFQIAGFVWWQGYKDQLEPVYQEHYEQNLVNLIKAVRKDFNAPDAPFVLATAGFGGWRPNGPWQKIMEAQLAVADPAKHPEFAGRVKTVEARDFWHGADESPGNVEGEFNKNAATYMDVGNALGWAMLELLKKSK